ncbi:MAG: dienelactone hydrolase family protein, partial [Flavobacteriaceae bacterium]|nr:dienelactone hydrolase family protein [Flavobacteriaceae bacterium]
MEKLSVIFFLCLLAIGCKQEQKKTVMAQQRESSEQLSASTRHHEWISLERENGSVLKAFLVYPERDDNADAVIV